MIFDLVGLPIMAATSWDSPPRVSFETPWPTIAAVVVALPVLAAALGGLFAREPAGSAPAPEKAS